MAIAFYKMDFCGVRHFGALSYDELFAIVAALLTMNTARIDVRLMLRVQQIPAEMGREEVIRTLAQEVAAEHFPGMGELLAETALEREAAEPTYLGRSLAVPHARVRGLSAAVVYVAPAERVLWHEEPVECVALLCVPEERPELHLQLLSRIVRWRMKGGELQLPAEL